MAGSHRSGRSKVDVDLLASEVPTIPSQTLEVLVRTKAWLDEGAASIAGLRSTYMHAEYKRKHERARLCPTPNGRDRRADSVLEKKVDEAGQESVQTDTLHYRWSNVCRLLRDSAGALRLIRRKWKRHNGRARALNVRSPLGPINESTKHC